MKREKIMSTVLVIVFVLVLVSGFLVQDWDAVGRNARAGDIVTGPAFVRFNSSVDSGVLLLEGSSYLLLEKPAVVFKNSWGSKEWLERLKGSDYVIH